MLQPASSLSRPIWIVRGVGFRKKIPVRRPFPGLLLPVRLPRDGAASGTEIAPRPAALVPRPERGGQTGQTRPVGSSRRAGLSRPGRGPGRHSLDSNTFSFSKFFLSKILTPGSDATKGEYEVRTRVGTSDFAKGGSMWTKNVILKTHPAAKRELKVGTVALFGGGDIWRRGVVASLDELYKNTVTLDLYWWGSKPDSMNRKEKANVKNLRVPDDPVFASPR